MQGFITALRFLNWQCASVGVFYISVDGPLYLITVSNTGIRIEFLPPYSPDLNPIEEASRRSKPFYIVINFTSHVKAWNDI